MEQTFETSVIIPPLRKRQWKYQIDLGTNVGMFIPVLSLIISSVVKVTFETEETEEMVEAVEAVEAIQTVEAVETDETYHIALMVVMRNPLEILWESMRACLLASGVDRQGTAQRMILK
jgi:hypothetical protein